MSSDECRFVVICMQLNICHQTKIEKILRYKYRNYEKHLYALFV